jgi:glucokinase-like ROK family protein
MAQRSSDRDLGLMHNINLGLLLEELRHNGQMTRTELSEALDVGKTSLRRLTSQLLANNMIVETAEGRTRRFAVNSNAGAIIGLDFQDQAVSAMATDFNANVLWHHVVPASIDMVKAQRIHLAEALIDDALKELKERKLRPLGIGVSIPGLVDRERGVLLYAPNLSWANVPLGASWSEKFDIPVYVENNANAGAIGEHFLGVAQNAASLVYLDLGLGIGGCIVHDGKPLDGAHGFAGEIGHMRMVPNGPRCGCGRRGCWEAVAGAEAVISEVGARIANGEKSVLTKEAEDPETPTIADLSHAAARRDKLVISVLEEASLMLGQGIANLVNILDPQLVVLGGRMSPLLPYLRDGISQTMRETTLLKPCRAKVVDSAYGNQAAMVGAVAMVMRTITQAPAPWLTEAAE